MLPEEIHMLINDGRVDEALARLKQHVAEHADSDDAWFVMGRLHWQSGRHADAVNCYRQAVEINPDSPARHALELATDVFDFFNPDLLNP